MLRLRRARPRSAQPSAVPFAAPPRGVTRAPATPFSLCWRRRRRRHAAGPFPLQVISKPFLRRYDLEASDGHPSLDSGGRNDRNVKRLGDGNRPRGDAVLIIATDGLWNVRARARPCW